MPANAVRDASDKIIKKALKKIYREQLPKERLIGPKNLYLENTVSKTDRFVLTTPAHACNINKSHISQYIAASIVCHCFDGWNFLSRGVEALLSGDVSSCIHFIYYSELRAVMTLMSCDGIGIFNLKHIYFDDAEGEHLFEDYSLPSGQRKKGTHAIADKLITEWANLGKKREAVFKIIKPNSRTLEDWITRSGHSTVAPVSGTVVKDWFDKWSIDLKLSGDQMLRNEMSYRPHFVISKVDLDIALQKIVDIWIGLEPTDANRFIELDRHLWRIAIEEIFKGTTGRPITHQSYQGFVNQIFDSNGESKTGFLYDFMFRRQGADNHILIEEAKKDAANPRINLEDPLPMICRAILLLRFATGHSHQLMVNCNTNFERLRFWWEDIAHKIGIINAIPSGVNPCDLYTEVRESIDGLNGYLSNGGPENRNENYFENVNTVKQFQRNCFWGLGL